MQRRAISSQGQRSSHAGVGRSQQQKAMKLPRLLANGDVPPNAIESSGLDIGMSSQQGKRPYQEDEFSIRPFLKPKNGSTGSDASDTHFFGLFDGHAGGRCSKFVAANLPDLLVEDTAYAHNLPQAVKRTFFTTNEQFMQIAERMKLHDGSTGIASIVRDGKVLVSNVGDCRCIILSNGKPIQMSVDQKPTSPEEQRRIAALGGTVVMCMGTARVNGVLAVSRAFGNRTLKSVIRPDPELSMREFTKDDDYLIMASDGLWDVLRNIDVCHIGYNIANQNQSNQMGVCQLIAEELVHSALARGSMDNVTCLCMRISGPHGLYQSYHNGGNSATTGTGSGNNSRTASPYPSQPGHDTRSSVAQYRSQFNSVSPLLTGNNVGSNISSSSNHANGDPNGSSVSDVLSAIMSSTSGGNRTGGRGGTTSNSQSNNSNNNNNNNNNPPNIGGNPTMSSAIRTNSGKKPHAFSNNYAQSRMGSAGSSMHGHGHGHMDMSSGTGFAEMKTDLSSSLGANARGGKPTLATMGKSQSMKRMMDQQRDEDMILADQSIVMDNSSGGHHSGQNGRNMPKLEAEKVGAGNSSGNGNSISRFMNSSYRLRGEGSSSSNHVYGGGNSSNHEGQIGMFTHQGRGQGGYNQQPQETPPSPITNPHRPNTHHGGVSGHGGNRRPMSVGGDMSGTNGGGGYGGHGRQQGNMPSIYQAGANSGMGGLRISPTGHNNLFVQHGNSGGNNSHGHASSHGHHSGY